MRLKVLIVASLFFGALRASDNELSFYFTGSNWSDAEDVDVEEGMRLQGSLFQEPEAQTYWSSFEPMPVLNPQLVPVQSIMQSPVEIAQPVPGSPTSASNELDLGYEFYDLTVDNTSNDMMHQQHEMHGQSQSSEKRSSLSVLQKEPAAKRMCAVSQQPAVPVSLDEICVSSDLSPEQKTILLNKVVTVEERIQRVQNILELLINRVGLLCSFEELHRRRTMLNVGAPVRSLEELRRQGNMPHVGAPLPHDSRLLEQAVQRTMPSSSSQTTIGIEKFKDHGEIMQHWRSLASRIPVAIFQVVKESVSSFFARLPDDVVRDNRLIVQRARIAWAMRQCKEYKEAKTDSNYRGRFGYNEISLQKLLDDACATTASICTDRLKSEAFAGQQLAPSTKTYDELLKELESCKRLA